MEYYKHRDGEVDYENYWKVTNDPDGVERERLESDYLINFKAEIDFVNDLNAGKILDIGCGLGWFFKSIKSEWTKYGIEVSKYARDKASREYGTMIYRDIYHLDSTLPHTNYFDVITLIHVIEHIENPLTTMKEVKRLLKPGGHLIIATPDFDSITARRFGDNYRLLHDKGHISLFSCAGMYRMLRDLGFEILKVERPFYETTWFTRENLLRLFDTSKVSPPAYGNFLTFYARGK